MPPHALLLCPCILALDRASLICCRRAKRSAACTSRAASSPARTGPCRCWRGPPWAAARASTGAPASRRRRTSGGVGSSSTRVLPLARRSPPCPQLRPAPCGGAAVLRQLPVCCRKPAPGHVPQLLCKRAAQHGTAQHGTARPAALLSHPTARHSWPAPRCARCRREWAEQHGLPAFASPEYDAALEAVCSRLTVHTGYKHRWVCGCVGGWWWGGVWVGVSGWVVGGWVGAGAGGFLRVCRPALFFRCGLRRSPPGWEPRFRPSPATPPPPPSTDYSSLPLLHLSCSATCSTLSKGLQGVGVHCGEVPRNCLTDDCGGYCSLGCARGYKQVGAVGKARRRWASPGAVRGGGCDGGIPAWAAWASPVGHSHCPCLVPACSMRSAGTLYGYSPTVYTLYAASLPGQSCPLTPAPASITLPPVRTRSTPGLLTHARPAHASSQVRALPGVPAVVHDRSAGMRVVCVWYACGMRTATLGARIITGARAAWRACCGARKADVRYVHWKAGARVATGDLPATRAPACVCCARTVAGGGAAPGLADCSPCRLT